MQARSKRDCKWIEVEIKLLRDERADDAIWLISFHKEACIKMYFSAHLRSNAEFIGC